MLLTSVLERRQQTEHPANKIRLAVSIRLLQQSAQLIAYRMATEVVQVGILTERQTFAQCLCQTGFGRRCAKRQRKLVERVRSFQSKLARYD